MIPGSNSTTVPVENHSMEIDAETSPESGNLSQANTSNLLLDIGDDGITSNIQEPTSCTNVEQLDICNSDELVSSSEEDELTELVEETDIDDIQSEVDISDSDSENDVEVDQKIDCLDKIMFRESNLKVRDVITMITALSLDLKISDEGKIKLGKFTKVLAGEGFDNLNLSKYMMDKCFSSQDEHVTYHFYCKTMFFGKDLLG